MPRNLRENNDVLAPAFTVTNWTDDVALDCNGEAGATALADVVGTLIKHLIEQGIINGTVSA